MGRKKQEISNEEINNDEMVGEEMTNTEILNEEVLNEEVATDATPEQEWVNNAGEVVSKSAFIREKFNEDNMSRKEISETYGIPYRTVYGATVNMTNEAEPSSRGRGITNAKINVTEANEVVLSETQADGTVKHFINGVEVESIEGIETIEVDRNTFIKEQVAAGVNRGELANYLGLSYGVIYGLTKDAEGTRSKYMITLEDGTEISRSEYIRQLVAEGMTKAEIAKKLGVEYSVVWQATKKTKSVEEKFGDAIAAIEKFADNVADAESFAAVIDMLHAIELKSEEATEEVETVEAK